MPWNGTFEAFEFGNQCLQKHSGNGKIVGDEDCLYLNVYVPDQVSSNDENTKYPVMIYIHGGAYQTGSGNPYGPDFLLEQNVIVVSLKFKLIQAKRKHTCTRAYTYSCLYCLNRYKIKRKEKKNK